MNVIDGCRMWNRRPIEQSRAIERLVTALGQNLRFVETSDATALMLGTRKLGDGHGGLLETVWRVSRTKQKPPSPACGPDPFPIPTDVRERDQPGAAKGIPIRFAEPPSYPAPARTTRPSTGSCPQPQQVQTLSRSLSCLPVIGPLRDAVDGSPTRATSSRQAIAPALGKGVFGPVAVPSNSDQGRIVGGFASFPEGTSAPSPYG